MYIVQWGSCFLADESFMGTVESKTSTKSMAKVFGSRSEVNSRIKAIQDKNPRVITSEFNIKRNIGRKKAA